MSRILRLNTATVEPQLRLNFWNNHLAQLYSGMSIDSMERNFSGRLLHVTVGRIGVMRVNSNHSVIRRTPVSTPTPKDEEIIKIHLQNRGTTINRQGQQEVCLQAGELTFCENRTPYFIEPSDDNDMFALELPYTLVKESFPDLPQQIMRRMTPNSLHSRLLFNLLHTIYQECGPDYQQDINLDDLENVMLELLRQTLNSVNNVDIDQSKKNEGLTQKLKSLVQQHLHNVELNTEMLATEAGISPRRVQALFAEIGTTPTFYIRDQRLDQAAEQLRYNQHQSVTQIALNTGFNDSAYFSRCFRQRYGDPPRCYRAQQTSC